AITVCALPRSDLQTSPTRTPAAEASIAARNPAPPAPMTSTSCSCVSYFVSAMALSLLSHPPPKRGRAGWGEISAGRCLRAWSQSVEPDVVERAARHLANVDIGEPVA